MNPEYQRTRFLAPPPAGGFPIRFGVITACNPNGLAADEARNAAATAQLQRQLQESGQMFFPVTGCSPDLAHQEPGFGVVCDSSAEMTQLGRAWRQEAVFWVEKGRVHLLPCNDGDGIPLGAWETLILSQQSKKGAEGVDATA